MTLSVDVGCCSRAASVRLLASNFQLPPWSCQSCPSVTQTTCSFAAVPECTSASKTTCCTPGCGELDCVTSSLMCRGFRLAQKADSASALLSPETVMTCAGGVLLYNDFSSAGLPLTTA